MLRITVPFTDEVLFDPANYAGKPADEVVVNQFDEVREAIELNIKSFEVGEITVYHVALNCQGCVLISIKVDEPAWAMNFTLAGQLNIQHTNIDKDPLALIEQTHHSFIPTVNEDIDIVIKGYVKLFIVCIESETVKKLLTAEEQPVLERRLKNYNRNIPGRIITTAMNNIINNVVSSMEQNTLHRVLLAAKMLELLFLDLEQLDKAIDKPNPPTVRFNDLEKLELAKTLIAEDMRSPCSLIELAHKVGLNDFKLKKGFKDAFGNTVFGYLFDMRMDKAKAMLATAQYTVSEVAHEVGYKNAHHFTAAFKKKFGYVPSKVRDR